LDHHYELDRTRGELRFGDGLNGRVPEQGAQIVARYWHAGGASGNIAQNQIHILTTAIPYIDRVTNPARAYGGSDAEPIEELRARAPALLRAAERAVTRQDYEQLVLRDPTIARARCVGPVQPGDFVRLLVIPYVAGEPEELELQQLVPDIQLMQRVLPYLEERRVLGTRFSLEPAYYMGIRVLARILSTDVDDDAVVRRAERALSTYLHPFLGGRDGRGWPFGRPVIAGELFGVLLDVAGVDIVDTVLLSPFNVVTGEVGEPVASVELDANCLVLPGRHQIQIMSK
jgi:predicted phage baseplate assembly protein